MRGRSLGTQRRPQCGDRVSTLPLQGGQAGTNELPHVYAAATPSLGATDGRALGAGWLPLASQLNPISWDDAAGDIGDSIAFFVTAL